MAGPTKSNKNKRSAPMPLEQQLTMDAVVQPKTRKTPKARRQQPDEEEQLTKSMSKKIMDTAKEQMEEMEAEETGRGQQRSDAPSLGRATLNAAAFHEQDSDGEDDAFSDEEDFTGDMHITEEEEALIERFMNPNAAETRTLADIIMDRIKEHDGASTSMGGRAAPAMELEEGERPVPRGMDPKAVEVYTEVGRLLTRYSTGKVPKAFKIIPSLSNWEEVLFITNPEGWSAHAMYQATRLFASNLNPKMAQRFYNLVLLPAVRDDVRANKRLHFGLFQALKKATYKPGAFYKGLLLPLCVAGDCTVREAVIWSSLLARVSIPVLHSAVAILKIAELKYSGTNSFFLMQLLNKKYALPHRVIDAVANHFAAFGEEELALPVIWHQALLTFVQRYKQDITVADKTRLKAVMKMQFHYLVTPEIRREIGMGLSRGEKASETAGMAIDPMSLGTAVHENPKHMPPVVMDEML